MNQRKRSASESIEFGGEGVDSLWMWKTRKELTEQYGESCIISKNSL